ncbi:MAG TPA: zinc-binding dehydrogenase [Anaeromyxobacter sp.]
MTTMRAAVLAAPRRIELTRVPRPSPGPGEVLVRLEGCGVCGSNLVPWQGREWFGYPFAPGAPGHEGWGRVAEVGAGVAGLAPGDRVALLSGAAFAEYDLAAVDRVVRIPDAVEGPFPGEALGCAVNVFRRAAIRAGDLVAVVGAGFIGLVALRLAALAGARVVALSRRATSLRRARDMGAAEVVALADRGEAVAAARRSAGDRLFDVVVEAVGNQAALDVASELVREGGRLVIAGYHQDGPRTVNLGLWNWRGIDVVNAHERDPRVQREGVLAAVGAVAEGKLDVTPLYATFPLDRLGAAFQAMEERPDGFVKALVTP